MGASRHHSREGGGVTCYVSDRQRVETLLFPQMLWYPIAISSVQARAAIAAAEILATYGADHPQSGRS